MKNTRSVSPCTDQTEKHVEAYYRTAEVGQTAVARYTQDGLLQYRVCEIEGRNPSRGRIYIHQVGAFYMKHGKNRFHPTGHAALVVPTERS